DLLAELDRVTVGANFDRHQARAFDLLGSAKARLAFDLSKEPPAVRDRYGRTHFGQSCLLARRLPTARSRRCSATWPTAGCSARRSWPCYPSSGGRRGSTAWAAATTGATSS